MKYKAIASNSKIYFGKDIPNMFVDSAGNLGKQFDGLADKLSFGLEDVPLEADTEENWKKILYNLRWHLKRSLFFNDEPRSPPSYTTFFDCLPRTMVNQEQMDLNLFPWEGRAGIDDLGFYSGK